MTNNKVPVRPIPWWAPPFLMLATAICAWTIVHAVQAGDGFMFFFALLGTAFSGLLAWGAIAARREQRRAAG